MMHPCPFWLVAALCFLMGLGLCLQSDALSIVAGVIWIAVCIVWIGLEVVWK